MVGVSGLGEALGAVPAVVRNSRFGLVLVLRLVLLAAVPIVLGGHFGRWRGVFAALLAAVVTALQSAHGHAVSMANGFDWLVLSTLLHLLAAGIWLGQLLPLLLLVRAARPDIASIALRRFTPLGLGCVLVLATTASFQGWTLVGGFPGFVGTAYGWMALTKLTLFAVLLCFAAANRYVLRPRLATDPIGVTKRRLCRSILAEILAGALVILAAGVLASLPPGMHEQLSWSSNLGHHARSPCPESYLPS
jgi:putative copper resistance protein D